MKSKPPTKKARLEAQQAAQQQLIVDCSLPILDKPTLARREAMSPSTSSGTSGLTPFGSSASSSKASTSITASELVAAAKAAAAAALAASSSPSSPSVIVSGTPLSPYPIFSIPTDLSISKECPRMNYILNALQHRSPQALATNVGIPDSAGKVGLPDGQALSMDDIDALQTELENLWSAAAFRYRILQNQTAILHNSPTTVNVSSVLGEHFDPHHQEKINAVATIIDSGHGTRTSVSAAAKLVMGPTSTATVASASVASPTGLSGRKSNNSASAGVVGIPLKLDKQPKKKLKGDSDGKSKRGENPAKIGQRTHSVSSDIGPFDSTCKHEAPNQFWEFADSYCRDITTDDLDDLERLIEEHRVVPDNLLDIPPLGKHFRDDEETTKIKDRERKEVKPKDVCGPLTQRLVAALVEDRVSTYNQHNNGIREESGEGFFINRPGLVRALGLDGGSVENSSSTPALEARLRQVLLEQGLLRSEDANDPLLLTGDDEILAEIHRTHNTFKKLHQYNMDKLDELHELAKMELERCDMRKELEKADKEVIDAYRTYASIRMKKKVPGKKERDAAFAALHHRQMALDKLAE